MLRGRGVGYVLGWASGLVIGVGATMSKPITVTAPRLPDHWVLRDQKFHQIIVVGVIAVMATSMGSTSCSPRRTMRRERT